MEEQVIVEKIKWLNDPNGGNIKISLLADIDDVFINLPENKELKNSFMLSRYRKKGWKWHQLVRIVLEPFENKLYMYDRILSLILKHRRSHEAYFEIKNDEGVFRVPNPLADMNRLELLYNQYFAIYKNIVEEIHFDYPSIEYHGPSIIGKINWTRTLTSSPLLFPLSFSRYNRKKEFDTPENILLILCAEWLYRDTNRLLHIQFAEPLTDYNKELLKGISERTKNILEKFPIVSVLNSSKKYWSLSNNDARIRTLENLTRKRLNQGFVINPNYSRLLEWLEQFRQLDISNISERTPTRHIIDPIQNIDTIYEVWIFMEFIEFVYEKRLLIDFQLGTNPNCKFEYGDTIITLWYEKEFVGEGPYAWIQRHKPDFTAMVDNAIIAVFDAKNYSKSTSISETKDKMLAYMTNLDANFGALIYPYYPKNWDDFNGNERIQASISIVSSQNPGMTEYDLKRIAKSLSNLSWNQLPKKYQSISPPLHIKRYQYPEPGKKARYHHDQTLCLTRMSPINTEQAISMKEKSLNTIFCEIVTRIPISIK
jgi:hypothetical protein